MRTKIIATIGPASFAPEVLKPMIEAGIDIARINFSHATYDFYREARKRILAISKKLKKEVKIQQDLRGSSIRVGTLSPDGQLLLEEEEVVFSTQKGCSLPYICIDDPYIHLDVRPGDPIYLTDGLIELEVVRTSGQLIYAKVLRGGRLYSNKSVNAPHTKLTTSGLTKKDIRDAKFAIGEGVDYVAQSCVQSAKDVLRLRKIVGAGVKITAKIEFAIALQSIDEIIRVSDAIMVARGGLGTEVSAEELPFIQKNILRHTAWLGKPCIVATQMLSSMIHNPRPTRAEVSDIANAVWDGADALMVSDETAIGKYPVDVIKTLVKVAARAEHYHFHRPNLL